MSIISSQNVVDKDGKTSAVLFGDSGVRSIGSQLRSALGTRVSGSGAYTSLAALGVRSDATGKISFDTAKLDAALNSDFDGVMNLFTNASTGLATTFKEKVDSLTHPVNGVIKARRDGIASRRSSIDERITTLESRLGRFEQRLINRYAALETTVSSFQAQGAALNSFF
jgi:flagellar hook-associated protein 2